MCRSRCLVETNIDSDDQWRMALITEGLKAHNNGLAANDCPYDGNKAIWWGFGHSFGAAIKVESDPWGSPSGIRW